MVLKPQLEKKVLKRLTGQRVLTSTEGLALLMEKEDNNVKHQNMSEFDELVEPSTSKLLKEAEQSKDGDVDNKDAVCCVSYE